jgi:hypothetical protein
MLEVQRKLKPSYLKKKPHIFVREPREGFNLKLRVLIETVDTSLDFFVIHNAPRGSIKKKSIFRS